MATSSNVKLRVPTGRSLTYNELDVNFQELKYVIDEYNQFTIDQSNTNDSLQNQLDTQTIEEAPTDSTQYARIDGTWQQVITTDSTWGQIVGTLSDQTDLDNRFTAVESDVTTLQSDLNTAESDINDLNNLQPTITTTLTNKTLQNTEFCYVKNSGLTITLPANPTVGFKVGVGVQDYTDTVINRNGKPIMRLSENMTINKENVTVTLLYVDATEGWRIV